MIDLDRAGIRSWYESGLIGVDSLVQKPGSHEWVPLGQAMDVRQWKAPAKPQGRSVPAGPSRARAPGGASGPAAAPSPSSRLADLPWRRMATVGVPLLVVGVLLYATSGFWLTLALGSPEARRMRAATTSQRELVDESIGLRLVLPPGWSLLKEGHGLFVPPADARLALAAPKEGALGIVMVRTPPRAFPSLDAFLDQVLAERRSADPSLREVRREDDTGGGRRAVLAREAPEGAVDERLSVWKDGWTYYALAVWGPAGRATAEAAAAALRPAFTTAGPLGGRLGQAVATVVSSVPLLTPRAAEMLMGQSAAQVLEPAEAFRRTYVMASRGLRGLSKAEQAEMGSLSSQMYATLPGRDRARLGAYIEHARNQQATDPRLDDEMSRLAKAAVSRLPPVRRARLQALFEKAIAAGLEH